MKFLQTKYLIYWIFLIGLIIRFIYFPENVYFGYDQARDAFVSEGILKGHFKIQGPPATFNMSLFHGPLAYYIFAPIYFISKGDPTLVSIFLRIYNVAGIFIVFFVASRLFDKKIGLFSALLFAFSYEQTQYSLFLSHPPFAVLTVLLFYFGLVKLFFSKDQVGLILALSGLGLSIQFHVSLIFLFSVLIASFLLFRKELPKFSSKNILFATGCFFISISSFIVAGFKYKNLSHLLNASNDNTFLELRNFGIKTFFEINRYIHDNLIVVPERGLWGLLVLLCLGYFILTDKKDRTKGIFLILWFMGGLIPYMLVNTTVYYYGIGGSLSLLILGGWIMSKAFSKNFILGLFLVFFIISSNLFLIISNNRIKFNSNIVVEEGLVLPQEKLALDYIYNQSDKTPFSVNAVTIPFNVNTTWDYLFGWYGMQKYGYVPIWGGDAASGYEGTLKVERARSKLPKKRFVIIEPTKNIPSYMVEGLLKEENYFSKIVEVKSFGSITIQEREAI